jgi:hypothetical protein
VVAAVKARRERGEEEDVYKQIKLQNYSQLISFEPRVLPLLGSNNLVLRGDPECVWFVAKILTIDRNLLFLKLAFRLF